MAQRHTTLGTVPDLDWSPEQARVLGEQGLDLWIELLAGLRALPVGRSETPDEVRAAVLRDVPDAPLPVDELMAHLRSLVMDHSMYPGHPRFMAYISGAGTAPGAVADLLAAALNQNVGGWMLSPSATEIEQHLLRWLGSEIGFPEGSGGIVASGGATATLIAMKAARDHHCGPSVRTEGVQARDQLVCYTSTEAHVVIDRAADILGLGSASVRHVPVDAQKRMRTDVLAEMLRADRAAGCDPFAVIGTAGTTATGSIDPLAQLADICRDEGLWFHVDGAYGAPAMLVPELRALFGGIERADSVALDPHKWLYVPLAVGCLLMRDARRLPDSFGIDASYIHQDRDHVERGEDLGFAGVQFSRGFAALKVWVSLLAHGRDAYAKRIHHDVELARYLDGQVTRRAEFQPMAPIALSIACFRFVPTDIDPSAPEHQPYLDRLNERLMTAIQADGRVFCSNADIDGRYALRACIVNFRTEATDIDALLDVVAELGAGIDAKLRASDPKVRLAR